MLRFKSWVVLAGIVSLICVSCASAGDLVIKQERMVKGVGPKTLAVKALKPLPFSDTCEGAFPGSWAPFSTPYFGPTTHNKFAGAKSYYCAQLGSGNVAAPGPYPSNFTGWITYGPFSLAGMTAGRVRFKLWNKSGAGDKVFAGWSLDDNTYEGFSWSGNSNGWIDAEADMSGYSTAYLGQSSVYFSFYYYSDTSANAAEGAYIDNISITAGSAPASNGGLTGTVKTNTGTVVKGAVVTAGTQFTYTDALGKYTLKLPAGTYAVKAQKPGYAFAPASVSVTVANALIAKNFTGTPRTGDGVVKYWAVSVGIANFQYINDLNYCDDDARDVTAALKAGGFPAANIHQLIDSQATKAGIKSAINWMISQADADDVCVFFQSSHGDQGPDVAPLDETGTGNDEYLCPYDTNSSHTTEIRDDELGQWMAALKTTKYVVMIDTCYAGGMIKSLGRPFGSGFARALNGMSTTGQMQTKDLDDLGSGVVIASCTDTELSEESASLQNGVFAYYLVQGMNNGKADANKDGWYSAEEVFNYSKTPAHTANPDQTLVIYDGYPGALKFAKAKTPTAPAITPALTVSALAAASASGSVQISVDLSAAANVSATVCNLAGRQIATLAPQDLKAGVSTLLWSGKSTVGTKVPAGMYLVKLQARDGSGNLANCLLSLRK